MTNTNQQLIDELRADPTRQQYSPVAIANYCVYARAFLDHLERRDMPVADVTKAQVEKYLHDKIGLFRKRRGRSPGPYWRSIPRAGIHALLRLAQGQWPLAPKATCAADAVRFTICDEYETWLRERGLTEPRIYALMWEGQNFLAWQLGRCGADSLAALGVPDIDCYVDLRAPKPANSGTT